MMNTDRRERKNKDGDKKCKNKEEINEEREGTNRNIEERLKN